MIKEAFPFGPIPFRLFHHLLQLLPIEVAHNRIRSNINFLFFNVSLLNSSYIQDRTCIHNVFLRFENGLWNNTVLVIISNLNGASSIRFVNGFLHRLGHLVRIENNQSIRITSGTTSCLRQRSFISKKAFLICIENRNQ